MRGTTMGPIQSPTGTTSTSRWPDPGQPRVVLGPDVEQGGIVGVGEGDRGHRRHARALLAGHLGGPELGRRRARPGGTNSAAKCVLSTPAHHADAMVRPAPMSVGGDPLDALRSVVDGLRRLVALDVHLLRPSGVPRPGPHTTRTGTLGPRAAHRGLDLDAAPVAARTVSVLLASRSPPANSKRSVASLPAAAATRSADGRNSAARRRASRAGSPVSRSSGRGPSGTIRTISSGRPRRSLNSRSCHDSSRAPLFVKTRARPGASISTRRSWSSATGGDRGAAGRRRPARSRRGAGAGRRRRARGGAAAAAGTGGGRAAGRRGRRKRSWYAVRTSSDSATARSRRRSSISLSCS